LKRIEQHPLKYMPLRILGVPKPDPARIPAIEGLRGVAMTLVFFGHFEALFRGYLPAGGASARLVAFLGVIGHQGVCFFLVLSGYFVYKSYLDHPSRYAALTVRRISRIYPPYVAMCGLYLVLCYLLPVHSKIPAGQAGVAYVALNLLMVSSRPLITVAWTIGTLVALYALLPPFWAAVRFERWKPVYRIALIMVCGAFWQYIPKSIPVLDGRVAFVLVGFALYEAMTAGAAFESRGELRGLAILSYGYLLWYAADRGWLSFLHLPKLWDHYAFLAPGIYYACGYVIHNRGRLAAFLGHLGLPRLGRISYAYYLCHGLVLKSLSVLLITLRPQASSNLAIFWLGLPVAYACTLIVGWSWFHVVEVRLAALFVRTSAPLSAVIDSMPPARVRACLPGIPLA
jgi:exopolysaccharide production protein ExoZ